MIVLDTNVVSEAMRPNPEPRVRAWLNRQAPETLYLSSVTLAELLFGVAVLPRGKRQQRLNATLQRLLEFLRARCLLSMRRPPSIMRAWPFSHVNKAEGYHCLMVILPRLLRHTVSALQPETQGRSKGLACQCLTHGSQVRGSIEDQRDAKSASCAPSGNLL